MFEDIFIKSGKEEGVEKRTLEVYDDNVTMDVKESYLEEARGDIIARMFARGLQAMNIPMDVEFKHREFENSEFNKWEFRMKLKDED